MNKPQVVSVDALLSHFSEGQTPCPQEQPQQDFQVENQPRAAYIGSTALHLRGDVQVGQCKKRVRQCPSWNFLWVRGGGNLDNIHVRQCLSRTISESDNNWVEIFYGGGGTQTISKSDNVQVEIFCGWGEAQLGQCLSQTMSILDNIWVENFCRPGGGVTWTTSNQYQLTTAADKQSLSAWSSGCKTKEKETNQLVAGRFFHTFSRVVVCAQVPLESCPRKSKGHNCCSDWYRQPRKPFPDGSCQFLWSGSPSWKMKETELFLNSLRFHFTNNCDKFGSEISFLAFVTSSDWSDDHLSICRWFVGPWFAQKRWTGTCSKYFMLHSWGIPMVHRTNLWGQSGRGATLTCPEISISSLRGRGRPPVPWILKSRHCDLVWPEDSHVVWCRKTQTAWTSTRQAIPALKIFTRVLHQHRCRVAWLYLL